MNTHSGLDASPAQSTWMSPASQAGHRWNSKSSVPAPAPVTPPWHPAACNRVAWLNTTCLCFFVVAGFLCVFLKPINVHPKHTTRQGTQQLICWTSPALETVIRLGIRTRNKYSPSLLLSGHFSRYLFLCPAQSCCCKQQHFSNQHETYRNYMYAGFNISCLAVHLGLF